MNTRLLYLAAEKIVTLPSELNLSVCLAPSRWNKTGIEGDIAAYVLRLALKGQEVKARTTDKPGQWTRNRRLAAELLQLEPGPAEMLFWFARWPQEFQNAYLTPLRSTANLKLNLAKRAHLVASYIHHFIERKMCYA